MREIIYIQAGPLANHVGTHFWNTQQCYFSYTDEEDVLVDHDISFREGISSSDEPTYCPRVLILDRKVNFGTLSRDATVYSDLKEDAPLWDGAVDEVRQDQVPQNSYQKIMEEEIDEYSDNTADRRSTNLPSPMLDASTVYHWSDYNRVYYAPRSFHKLPDTFDFENDNEDWSSGKSLFERYDAENNLLDDSFRRFVEESDSCQGVNLSSDASLASFSVSLLAAIHDENPKLSYLSFPFLEGFLPEPLNRDDLREVRRILNDARHLSALAELATLSIPLKDPSRWQLGPWSEDLELTLSSRFEVSAVLSAHMESNTLPTRLKASTAMLDFCSQLNYYGNTPFAEMSGAMPLASLASLDERLQNFTWTPADSKAMRNRHSTLLFRRDVFRGLADTSCSGPSNAWDAQSATAPPITSLAIPVPYPLPTSFPYFFRAPHLNDRSVHTPKGILTKKRSVPLASSLGLQSDGLPRLIGRYASFVDDCVRGRVKWNMVGIDQDDARDLAAALWTMHDNFGSERSGKNDMGAEEEI